MHMYMCMYCFPLLSTVRRQVALLQHFELMQLEQGA